MGNDLRSVLKTILADNNDSWRIKLLAHWNSIMGKLATRVRLEKIETVGVKNILTLGVYESVWLHELHMLSPTLIKTINGFLGHSYVQSINYKLVIKQKTVDRSLKNKIDYKPALQKELTNNELNALSKIRNHELRLLLERFLKKCSENN